MTSASEKVRQILMIGSPFTLDETDRPIEQFRSLPQPVLFDTNLCENIEIIDGSGAPRSVQLLRQFETPLR